jgi:beta-1,4-galactosyltransferase 4
MLSIVVPYRNREDQLEQFIPHMNKYLPEAKIVIVEQADDKPFNRARLINVGFLEFPADHICAHDVDMLPINVFYYEYDGVQQKASSEIQRVGYLGGVTIFDANIFWLMCGYHNDYFCRAEDCELAFHLKRLQIPVRNSFGTFHQLPHPRTGPEFIPELWQKAQVPRTKNMLKTCEYQLISKEVHETHVHLKVTL